MSQDFFQSRCSYCHPSFFTKFFFLSHRLTSPVQRLIVSYLRSRLMTSFPARSAFTTAEQTEPLPLQLLAFCFQLLALRSSRPVCEAFQCVLCVLWTEFRAFSYYYRSFSCFFAKIFLNGHELSHDILCISRSDDNRRTAGAVDFSVFRVHYV